MISSFCLVSCDKNNDENDGSIVGTWDVSDEEGIRYGYHTYMVFYPDNVCYFYSTYESELNDVEKVTYRYDKSSGRLTVSAGDEVETITIGIADNIMYFYFEEDSDIYMYKKTEEIFSRSELEYFLYRHKDDIKD